MTVTWLEDFAQRLAPAGFAAGQSGLLAPRYEAKLRECVALRGEGSNPVPLPPPTHLHKPTPWPPVRPFFLRAQRALRNSALPRRLAGRGCRPHFAVSVSFRLNRLWSCEASQSRYFLMPCGSKVRFTLC